MGSISTKSCIHNAIIIESSGTSTRSENIALNRASSSTSAMAKPAKRARAQEVLQEKNSMLVGLYHRKATLMEKQQIGEDIAAEQNKNIHVPHVGDQTSSNSIA